MTMTTQQEWAGSVDVQGPFKRSRTSSEEGSGRLRAEDNTFAFLGGVSNVVGDNDDGDVLEHEVTQ